MTFQENTPPTRRGNPRFSTENLFFLEEEWVFIEKGGGHEVRWETENANSRPLPEKGKGPDAEGEGFRSFQEKKKKELLLSALGRRGERSGHQKGGVDHNLPSKKENRRLKYKRIQIRRKTSRKTAGGWRRQLEKREPVIEAEGKGQASRTDDKNFQRAKALCLYSGKAVWGPKIRLRGKKTPSLMGKKLPYH